MIVGYARVSARDQDLAGQVANLEAAGCVKVYREKISGAKTDRPELGKLMRRLEEGDTVIVTRLDRLGRSTRESIEPAGGDIRPRRNVPLAQGYLGRHIDMHGRLLVTVLGSLAEFERELIRERTGEGRKRAKARGVRFGRPNKLTPHQRREILDRIAAGEIQADLARTYNVGEATISRLAARGPFETSAAVGV